MLQKHERNHGAKQVPVSARYEPAARLAVQFVYRASLGIGIGEAYIV